MVTVKYVFPLYCIRINGIVDCVRCDDMLDDILDGGRVMPTVFCQSWVELVKPITSRVWWGRRYLYAKPHLRTHWKLKTLTFNTHVGIYRGWKMGYLGQ